MIDKEKYWPSGAETGTCAGAEAFAASFAVLSVQAFPWAVGSDVFWCPLQWIYSGFGWKEGSCKESLY